MNQAMTLGKALLQALRKEDQEIVAKALGIKKDTNDANKTQSQEIIEIALARGVELFHTPEGETYATVKVGSHKETWPITSRGSGPFRNWLRQEFYKKYGKPPGNQALQDAIGTLEAKAQFDGRECPVYTRLAEHDGKIYLDLANKNWQVVEIGPEGWRVIGSPPVKFQRTRGMLPLPYPEKGGSIEELRPFINAPDEATWILMLSWLVAALRPRGPYPVLFLQGEQGAAKSTTARVLRALVDPFMAPLRTSPREERDLMIAANNSWILAFDNLSGIPNWLSDAICRVATGAGFSTRKLYENKEETIISVCRPVVANGIDELASRHDLLDRAVILNLPPIPESKRVDESTFWNEFEKVRPRILGALLDAVAVGLRNLPKVKLSRLPRMADFARWVTACEEALPWPPGRFLEAYTGNKSETIELAIEADVVATAVKKLVEEQNEWVGTAQELLIELEKESGNYATEKIRKSPAWPKSPRGLSNRLRRAATFLRQAGIEVEFHKASGGKRLIRLTGKICATTATCGTKALETLENQGVQVVAQTVAQSGAKEKRGNFAPHLEGPKIKARGDSGTNGAEFHTQSENSDFDITGSRCKHCGTPIDYNWVEGVGWTACDRETGNPHRC